MTEPFWETNLIYKVVAGSHAYGLATETSDMDVRGVCIPPRRHLLGLTPFEQHEERSEASDTVIFALAKFVRLAVACNPTIVELLFTEPQHVLFVDDLGERLLAQRRLFLSRLARQTFADYALSQLKRMQRHHRWLIDPPDHAPTQDEFGARPEAGRWKFPDQDAYQAYQAALKHWNQYDTWRRERNPQRAELERRYGYDTKHAAHLLRLLTMGIEILETGQVHVWRPDRDWLLAVRRGLLTYEQLLQTAAERSARLEAAEAGSPLPAQPDQGAAEKLVVEIQEEFLWRTRKGA